MAKASQVFTTTNKVVSFAWIDPDFTRWFGDMKIEGNVQPLISKTLPRAMTSQEIQDELKPEYVSLAEIYETLKILDHSVLALFYAKDSNGVARLVRARWDACDGGWLAYALSVLRTHVWRGEYQVFSRNSLDTQKLESLELGNWDTRILALEQQMKKDREDTTTGMNNICGALIHVGFEGSTTCASTKPCPLHNEDGSWRQPLPPTKTISTTMNNEKQIEREEAGTRDWGLFIGMLYTFLAGVLVGVVWFSLVHTLQSSQVPTEMSDSKLPSVIQSVPSEPPVSQSEVDSITNRLDALDGGKEKRWNCLGRIGTNSFGTIRVTNPEGDIIFSPIVDYNTDEIWYPENGGIFRTIGLETPKQLGYSHCTLIPESQWEVTKEPIN